MEFNQKVAMDLSLGRAKYIKEPLHNQLRVVEEGDSPKFFGPSLIIIDLLSLLL